MLPDKSDARHVTSVVPIGKRLPEEGRHATVVCSEHWSVAAAIKSTIVPVLSVNGIVILEGQMMFGGIVSSITMIRVAVPIAPRIFVAV